MGAGTGNTEIESSERELYRLIAWIKDNPEDWVRICCPENFDTDIEYFVNLIERLYNGNLLTVMYFVIYSKCAVSEVDWAITRTTNEYLLDNPINILVERLLKNMKISPRMKTKNEQDEPSEN
jgi:hypothetical protein